MAYKVDPEKCEACGACIDACPNGAITLTALAARIDPALCVSCGGCEPECPARAIEPE